MSTLLADGCVSWVLLQNVDGLLHTDLHAKNEAKLASKIIEAMIIELPLALHMKRASRRRLTLRCLRCMGEMDCFGAI